MDENNDVTPSGPLAGKLVIDLSRALAGPHATMMLADMGARVIKVEAVGSGDDSRGWGPPFVGPHDAPVSTYFLSANRNKESVQLDLKSDEGRQILQDLVVRADVVVENFRTGVLDRLGFSTKRLHTLNPGLVILSITGFGHDGPDADRPGYDQIAQGEAGLMSFTGPASGEPTRVGVPIGDLLAGIHGAYGVAAALVDREQTGRGMIVRTSLLAAIVGVHAFQGTRYTVAGEIPEPIGNHHPSIAPYGAFRTADGVIQVAVGNEGHWRAFTSVVGLDADDERFTTGADRVRNRGQLSEVIESLLAGASSSTWLDRLTAAGVPAGAVRNLADVYEWEQTRSQGLIIEVDHPTAGRVALPGPVLRLEHVDGSPATRSGHTPPPLLGEHDATVRAWLASTDD